MANLNLTQEKLEAIRSEYKHRNVRAKYPRQKMLPEYRFIYPWVLADEKDPYFSFCTVCECRLSAKRSDLGKHENSIKHTENASKKGMGTVRVYPEVTSGLVIKGSHSQQVKHHFNNGNAEYSGEILVSEDDDDENEDISEGIYIKHEPVVDLIENSNPLLNLAEFSRFQFQNSTDIVDDDDYDDEEYEEYEEQCDKNYRPDAKRRSFDTDSQSQHYSTADNLGAVQVTVNDANSGQRFSIRELTPAGPYATSSAISSTVTPPQQYTTQKLAAKTTSTQAPCKITIKKITSPITPATPQIVNSTASIMPAVINISQQPATIKTAANLTASTSLALTPSAAIGVPAAPQLRDCFDLFFESICASVKALPPKLATEGKIRVMQLIGELEIRAITERELGNSSATGQQNSTVVSTTK